jgi:hypothetical protein
LNIPSAFVEWCATIGPACHAISARRIACARDTPKAPHLSRVQDSVPLPAADSTRQGRLDKAGHVADPAAPVAKAAKARVAAESAPPPGAADRVIATAALLVPLAVSIGLMSTSPDAAHDPDTARALGGVGPWYFRALDLPLASFARLVPLGTQAFRASLLGAVGLGLGGLLASRLVRSLSRDDKPYGITLSLASALGVLSAQLSAPWQIESSTPGGAVLGALLALAPMALALRAASGTSRLVPVACALGIAASYDLQAFALALAGTAALLLASPRASLAELRAQARACALSLGLGLSPFIIALAHRWGRPEDALHAEPLRAVLLGSDGVGTGALAFVRQDWGYALGIAAITGLALALRKQQVRALAVALAVTALASLLMVQLGSAAGPTRYGVASLVATLVIGAFAAVGLRELLFRVYHAPIPFARASVGLGFVLFLALPARMGDEAADRLSLRASRGAQTWTDVALGGAPPGALLVVRDASLQTRLMAAEQTAQAPADVRVLSVRTLHAAAGARAVAGDAKLGELYRDMLLRGAPEERTLVRLSEDRPLLWPYEPADGRVLARHLVPTGLLLRFDPEPRGRSDRKDAMDVFTSQRDALSRAAMVRAKDPVLSEITTRLLRRRALAIGATDDRELLSRAVDDLRHFSDTDPLVTVLSRRMIATRGGIEVEDLAP